MIKTAEVAIPQSIDPRLTSPKFVLYNAFRKLSQIDAIKPYPGWREDRNGRWMGGLTAEGKLEGFEDFPLATVLRESKGMVQLLVVNKDAWVLDKASDYKNGWEFSDRDPAVMLNAVVLKKRSSSEVFVSYRTQLEPSINANENEEIDSQYREAVILAIRQISFERGVEVIAKSQPRANIATQILTSPLWRDYNFALDGKNISREGEVRDITPGEILMAEKYGTN